MIRVDRAVLVEASFKLGACAESLTVEVPFAGNSTTTDLTALSKTRVEAVRKTLFDIMQLLSKEAK